MTEKDSNRFVHEIELITTPHDKKILNKRLRACEQLYNACLSECKKRISKVKNSKTYQKAIKDFKLKRITKEKRNSIIRNLNKKYLFSEYDMQGFVSEKEYGHCWIYDHIDSQVRKQIAKKAFKLVEKESMGLLPKDKKGRPGRVRFAKKGSFQTMEQTTGNKQSITWKNDRVIWNVGRGKNSDKLELMAKLNFNKDKKNVLQHALSSELKTARLVKKIIKGKEFWFAQLTLVGLPKQRHSIGAETVGIDIGPQTYALVSDSISELNEFCAGLVNYKNDIARIQKLMDRSRRKTNPLKFKENGTINTSNRDRWIFSKRYIKLRSQMNEYHRKMIETRKKMHGELVNRIITIGNHVKLEKLSYKSFQRNYGKSVGFKSPGFFVSKLKTKLEQVGGTLEEISTYDTKMSQYCHMLNDFVKKPLSQRYHEFPDGTRIQRDLYSAFLAKNLVDSTHDSSHLSKEWASAEPLLRQAESCCKQSAIGVVRPSTLVYPSQS